MAENGRPRRKTDDNLMVAIARGETVVDAASIAGMSERTAYRRLADPQFQAGVDNVRHRMTARAVAKVAEASAGAVYVLKKLLESSDESIKSRAAKELAGTACGVHEAERSRRTKVMTETEGFRHGDCASQGSRRRRPGQ